MEWRDVDGFPGYKVSDTGLVLGIKNKNKALKPKITKNGYAQVVLCNREGKFGRNIHRLVLLSFKPITDCITKQVNHIDGNKLNNNLANLEWTTMGENMRHASLTNLVKSGEDNANTRLTKDAIHSIVCLLLNTDLTYRQIADYFSISESTIAQINRGITWKKITNYYTKNYPIRCRQ